MGQKPGDPPVNIPIPTKIGSKKGLATKMGSQNGLDTPMWATLTSGKMGS